MQAVRSKGAMLEQIDLNKTPRSGYDMSYNCHGTGTLGRLYPIRAIDVIPGDRWQGQTDINVNFQPLAVPVASNLYMRTETFFVPNRILWDNWESHWTKGERLDDVSIEPNFRIADIMAIFQSYFTQLGVHAYRGYIKTILDKEGNPIVNIRPIEDPIGDTLLLVTSRSVYSALDSLENYLNNLGTQQEVLDLLQPIFDTIQSFRIWIADNTYRFYNTSYDSEGFEEEEYEEEGILLTNLFPYTYKGVYSDNTEFTSTRWRAFSAPITEDGVISKDQWSAFELYDIVRKVVSQVDVPIVGSRDNLFQYVYEPNEESRTFIRYFYDCLRPLVGLGSNLDYLGFPVFSFDDFEALFTIATTRIYLAMGIDNLQDEGTRIFVSDGGVLKYVEFGSIATEMPLFSNVQYSVLALRALYQIWYWNYRDQLIEVNAQEPQTTDVVTDTEMFNLLVPRVRAWTKDTFTTALTNTGTGSVIVSINENAVQGNSYRTLKSLTDEFDRRETIGYTEESLQDMDVVSYKVGSPDGFEKELEFPTRYLLQKHGSFYNDAGSTYGFSLDMLNRAKRLQKWIQKALIYGNRPQDAYWTHFSVRTSDVRLYEPEYITGDNNIVNIQVVMNNTTTAESVAGEKTGNAFGDVKGSGLNYFSEEHGHLITMFTIMPESVYGYGINKNRQRLDAFDLPFPEFSQLGMDAVYTDEMVVSPLSQESLPCPTEVFGYQGRYYDYKSKQDEIHGEFRGKEMDGYTFARKFSVYEKDKFPKLNYAFIHAHPRKDMFVADDPTVDLFWFDARHSQALERALPVPSQTY